MKIKKKIYKIDGGKYEGEKIQEKKYKGFEKIVVNGGRWNVRGREIVSGEKNMNGGDIVVKGKEELGVKEIKEKGGEIEE